MMPSLSFYLEMRHKKNSLNQGGEGQPSPPLKKRSGYFGEKEISFI